MRSLDTAVIVEFPTIIKAHSDAGRRMVEVESSCEAVDLEGDVILQKALIESAPSFLKSGHLDLEHFSEIGHRIGIRDPASFIVGRPVEVKDIGSGRTSVVGEISRSADGIHNPTRSRADAFWDTLTCSPPIVWKASVFGYPSSDAVTDCRTDTCPSGATRFEIKAMDWRSLAFTRTPVNDSLTEPARIITAKSLIARLIKSGEYVMPGAAAAIGLSDTPAHAAPMDTAPPVMPPSPGYMQMPRTLADSIGQYHHHMKRDCPFTGGLKSTFGFKQHFTECCGMPPDLSELHAHALMHSLLLDKRRT